MEDTQKIEGIRKVVQERLQYGRKLLQEDQRKQEALSVMKEALKMLTDLQNLVKRRHSTQSKQFLEVATDICNVCNILAVNLMKEPGGKQESFGLLNKAYKLAENNEKAQAMTANNLGLYYKQIGSSRLALLMLEEALDLESRQESTESKAETHLNTCAVLSGMDRHDLAMTHAYQAIMIMQTTLLQDFLPSREVKDIRTEYHLQKTFKDRVSVLCIAYHNLAVEQEYMKLYSDAVQSYKIAHGFAQTYLGTEDGITKNLQNIYEQAKKVIQKTQKLEEKKLEGVIKLREKRKEPVADGKNKGGFKMPKKFKPKDIVKQEHDRNLRIQKLKATKEKLKNDNMPHAIDELLQGSELSSPTGLPGGRIGRPMGRASPSQSREMSPLGQYQQMKIHETLNQMGKQKLQRAQSSRRSLSQFASANGIRALKENLMNNQPSVIRVPSATSNRHLSRFNQTAQAYGGSMGQIQVKKGTNNYQNFVGGISNLLATPILSSDSPKELLMRCNDQNIMDESQLEVVLAQNLTPNV